MSNESPKRMSYVQFAAKHGLVTDYEVQGHIHGGLMAAHMPKSYHRRYQRHLEQLQNARAEGMARYRKAIEDGEVMPPHEPSHTERLMATASGDPDRPSTQAAIRVLKRIAERQRQAAMTPHPQELESRK